MSSKITSDLVIKRTATNAIYLLKKEASGDTGVGPERPESIPGKSEGGIPKGLGTTGEAANLIQR